MRCKGDSTSHCWQGGAESIVEEKRGEGERRGEKKIEAKE